MSDYGVDSAIRQAIGGDPSSIAWILANADTFDDAAVIAMAALLERHSKRLRRAEDVAATSRDRQLVAIARAHLDGENELVDALARDHLVDYPDSLIVSWMASGALVQAWTCSLLSVGSCCCLTALGSCRRCLPG